MKKVAAGIDDLADVYDRFRIGYASDVYDALFDYGVSPGARVLDLGCGTGLVAAEMARRGTHVVGLDVSQAMLDRARVRLPQGDFRLGRAESLPFDDAVFDAGLSAQSFHWFVLPRALDEHVRVVRAGGVVGVWWKGLMRGDGMRSIREEVAREIGLAPPPDLLSAGFAAFESSALVDRRLRVIPWQVTLPVENFLGYERSRARSRDAYGDRLGEYMERLTQRLGGSSEISLFYTHLLYLGRVPAARS